MFMYVHLYLVHGWIKETAMVDNLDNPSTVQYSTVQGKFIYRDIS